MKKLVMLLAIAAVFAACGNPSHVSETPATCDSCQVDSVEFVETTIDSVSVDTISE